MAKNTPAKQLATQEPNELSDVHGISAEAMEKLIVGHDLSGLNPKERASYYIALCKSTELNPLTRPFAFISMDGKMVLYALKDCTDQIRKRDEVQIKVISRESVDGLYIVTVEAKNKWGREDQSIGVEALVEPESILDWHPTERGKKIRVQNTRAGFPLDAAKRANAMMKAETKAKRRATLSLGGLGMPDESDIDAIAANSPVTPQEQIQAETQQAAIENERAETAASGVTVKEIPVEVVPSEPAKAKPWQEVVIRAGTVGGRMWDKPLGPMHPDVIAFIHDEWLKTAGNQLPPEQLAAVREAYAATRQQPHEAAQPEKSTDTPQEPQKVKKATPRAKKEAPAKPAETGWRSVAVDLPESKTCHGRTLGDIADAAPGDIRMQGVEENSKQKEHCDKYAGPDWIRSLALEGIPALRKKGGHEALIDAINAAADELDVCSTEWTESVTPARVLLEVRRRFGKLGKLTDEEIVAALTGSYLTEGQTIADLTEGLLRGIIKDWDNVAEVTKGGAQ